MRSCKLHLFAGLLIFAFALSKTGLVESRTTFVPSFEDDDASNSLSREWPDDANSDNAVVNRIEPLYFATSKRGTSPLVRMGKRPASSMVRFGKRGSSSMVRFGKRGSSSMVRFGKRGSSSMVRFGRAYGMDPALDSNVQKKASSTLVRFG